MSTLRVNTIQDAAGTGNAAPTPIGVGQTWQSVTGSRAIGTTYTNSTGRPIAVSVIINTTTSAITQLVIAGIAIAKINTGVAGGSQYLTGIVPAGATYAIQNVAGSQTVDNWLELR